jgi:hypothetical protein
MNSLTYYGFSALCLSYLILTLARWLKRRARLREFAATHGLRYRGTLPSDKYEPYKSFGYVARSVLLHNVMEGTWNGVDTALFDFGVRRGTCTGVIVSLPHDYTHFQVIPRDLLPGIRMAVGEEQAGWVRVAPDGWALGSDFIVRERISEPAAAIGPRTTALLKHERSGFIETYLGHLFVSPMRQIAPDDLPTFLLPVSVLARALEADAEQSHTKS